MKQTTFGVIVGNRGFFPSTLCKDGRSGMLSAIESKGYKTISLSPEETNVFGAIESLADARKCADLFRKHRDEIDGIIVTLPNFGDERAIANALRWADLNVPVLIQAYPDDVTMMTSAHRRDSFCGKISVTNNLRQYGIKFSLTTIHTVSPEHESFKKDLDTFGGTCRIVKRLRNARVGAIGARPAAFNTVRYSEKLLENAGITVEVLDLSEVFGRINKLKDDEQVVVDKVNAIKNYVSTKGIPEASLVKMSKLGVVVDRFVDDNQLIGTAIQCWTSMEEYFGVVPCTIMSMSSNVLSPSACEVDIVGMLGMLVLQEATLRPSAIVDWNNNYADDPDKCVIFHCSNLPKDIFQDMKMDYQAIIAGTVGKENTYGTIVGQIAPGPLSYARVSTDDLRGKIVAYTGEGEFTNDKLNTFGGYGVIKVPKLQDLLSYICKNGFEHHVAVNRGAASDSIADALGNYLGWEVYHHKG
ncbi:MAG: L-fucose/L-arabinose isomerase family protein [Verrucomicrobiota bacterium]|nr:L-fucose/L-arabinose isomerase family protein [Verrucomicrobiota bacterium]